MSKEMMTGGCIHVWIKDVPDPTRMKLLEEYSDKVVKRIDGWFDVRIRKPKITWLEKLQIKWLIGYIPKCEFLICGGTDCIFLAAEALMREFDGYYSDGVPEGKDMKYYSLDYEYGRLSIGKHYLTNVEPFSAYFNSEDCDEIKKLYSFS